MEVAVVIPVKDDERIFSCVASVLACRFDGAVHVIVVENGSNAAFRQSLERLPSPVTVLTGSEPGVYGARNRAIDIARGEVIFFTDADCVVDSGWLAAGVAGLATTGADLLQGLSGSLGSRPVDLLIQRRYEAHLRRTAPGNPTECDTRNLAVRREVLAAIRFNPAYRRVGDTELGLLAERAGWRVAYWPGMRLRHHHDHRLATFLAKQACHGWGAQRLMHEHPDLRWHGGHLRLVAAVTRRMGRVPGRSGAGRLLIGLVLASGRILDRLAGRVPLPIGFAVLTALDKMGALGGHLLFEPGSAEPSPSDLLGERLPRD